MNLIRMDSIQITDEMHIYRDDKSLETIHVDCAHPVHLKKLVVEGLERCNIRIITCDHLIFKNAKHYMFNFLDKRHTTLTFDSGFIQPDAFHQGLITLIIINGARFSTRYKFKLQNYQHLLIGVREIITDDVTIIQELGLDRPDIKKLIITHPDF